MKKTNPLSKQAQRILILSDGIAGHDRSSLGIVTALGRHRSIDVRVLPIRETMHLSRRAKRMLAGLLPFRTFWSAFYDVEGEASSFNPLPLIGAIPDGGVDLVVSTGPRTAAANIALARQLKAKNVYFGFSKWPSDSGYTVLLTSERGRPHRNLAYALRPSELDGTGLPEARPLTASGSPRAASLLFGGQSKHYDYSLADMEILAERLIQVARGMPGLHWTIFDSRRSPEVEFDRLEAIVKKAGAAIEFARFRDRGLLSNSAAFASDLVLVTADSMSMLTESIASRRPTGILFADRYRPPKRDAIEHASMITDKRAFSLTFSTLTPEALLAGAGRVEVLPGSQLDVLYETLAGHGI